MNSTIADLINRRSCRKFKADAVSEDALKEIVLAGQYAPSGMGRQSTRMIVVTNKEMRDRISDDNRKVGGWPEGFDPFYGAPAIIIVLADKSFPTSVYDASLVLGNLMNAAHALGLGSIWIHRAKEEFEMGYYKELLKSLGIDGDFEGVGHCAIGYIDGGVNNAAPRKEDHVAYIK